MGKKERRKKKIQRKKEKEVEKNGQECFKGSL